jgi:hypothetical protein
VEGVVRYLLEVTFSALNLFKAVKINLYRVLNWEMGYDDIVVILLAFKYLIGFNAASIWEASRRYASISDAVLFRHVVIFVLNVTVKVNYASGVIDNSFADTRFWCVAHALLAAATMTAAFTMAILADIGVCTYWSTDI